MEAPISTSTPGIPSSAGVENPNLSAPGPQQVLLGAAELAEAIRDGLVTSVEATESFIARCRDLEPLRALVQPLFESALREAEEADRARAAGRLLGPLHGVPVSVKDCFEVRGAEVTLGIPGFSGGPAEVDSPLVRRLRDAGAVLLGKTNVPQGMLIFDCDNPVFGRTLHPFDPTRSPGGSTGGEGALVAAGGSPLGLGSDLGGSIRQPAHACGVAGLKPTAQRLSLVGSRTSVPGMRAMTISPGPIAPCVADLDLAMRVLVPQRAEDRMPDELAKPWPDYRQVNLAGLRVATWEDDGLLPTAPAIARAVRESAAALAAAGAEVRTVQAPDPRTMFRIYIGLISADGMQSLKRLVEGGPIDPQVARQLKISGLSRTFRDRLAWVLRRVGLPRTADVMTWAGPRSADAYWRLSCELEPYREFFWKSLDDAMDGRPADAVLLPPFGVTAMPHGRALDLVSAASHCFYANVLDAPAGVVPWTQVRPEEQSYPGAGRGPADVAARATAVGSAGLPVGVQVMARPWREDVTLALMGELERRRVGF